MLGVDFCVDVCCSASYSIHHSQSYRGDVALCADTYHLQLYYIMEMYLETYSI